jgi:hypothetical protein
MISHIRPLLALTLLLCAALALAVSFARESGGTVEAQVVGGPVFVSGDDAEDHCEEDECGGLYAAVLNSAVDLSLSPGAGILAIGMTDDDNVDALNSWNDPAFGGPDVPITTVSGAGITTADFADFDVIFVPSNEDDGDDPGINNTDLALLNARSSDIANFVNVLGGGLIALTEADADPALAFGFLPIPLEFENVEYFDAEPTAALADLAPAADSDNLDHDAWHNIWTGPAGFGGLEVLAVTAEVLDELENPSVAILGGAHVILQTLISLDPLTATNTIGEDHTVTATVSDLAGDPVAGAEVSFEVTAGPNAGDTGAGTTDANGQASFTYTGDGGTGTDTIEACFTPVQETPEVSAAALQQLPEPECATASKTWVEPEATATPSPTPTVAAAALPPTGGSPSDGVGLPWLAIAAGIIAISSGGLVLAYRARRVR